MAISADTSDRVLSYFRSKSKELLAATESTVCEHSGLTGGHREQVNRIYLAELLPKRFSVGRGMVYGPIHRSREADAVIWDSNNFPSLQMSDHAMFLADSVRLVLEIKSCFSVKELRDVSQKVEAIHTMWLPPKVTLAEDLAELRGEIQSIQTGDGFAGMGSEHLRIATAAMFLRGGRPLRKPKAINKYATTLQDGWPDLLVCLEEGILVQKRLLMVPGASTLIGVLEAYDIGENVLLAFSSGVMHSLFSRVIRVETVPRLDTYLADIKATPLWRHEFGTHLDPPGITQLWIPNKTDTDVLLAGETYGA